MPKLKTHSGAKKRFKVTANGKVKYQQTGKRHGLFKTDGDNVIRFRLPNSR
jgi:large subunit ribosomal protein L35